MDLQNLLAEITLAPTIALRTIDRATDRRPITVLSDSASFVAAVHRDTGRPADKRFRITLAALREVFHRGARHNLRWLPTWPKSPTRRPRSCVPRC